MVLISVLELLPEATAVEGLGLALAVAALGAGFVFALHLIIPHVHLVEEHGRDPRAQRSAYLVAFGLILHDVPEGFAMANAYIVIGFIDRESPLGQEYLAHQAENVFYRHARFFAAAEVEALLEQAGFRDLSWVQTLYEWLPAVREVAPLRDLTGQGAFLVVRGSKR